MSSHCVRVELFLRANLDGLSEECRRLSAAIAALTAPVPPTIWLMNPNGAPGARMPTTGQGSLKLASIPKIRESRRDSAMGQAGLPMVETSVNSMRACTHNLAVAAKLWVQ